MEHADVVAMLTEVLRECSTSDPTVGVYGFELLEGDGVFVIDGRVLVTVSDASDALGQLWKRGIQEGVMQGIEEAS